MSELQTAGHSLVGPDESQRLMGALQRGATRRDVLAMLVAGGMQVTLAGSLASTALSAHAQTPKRGGKLRVAGATAAATDTLDPSKQSNQTDYSRCNMLYNGLTWLDGSLTPQPALAESFTTKDAKTWVFTLRKGVQLPRRQAADARRRRLLDQPPQGPGDGLEGQGAGRPDRKREGLRAQRSDDACSPHRTPTCR